jgi:hypothetical protein
VSLYSIGYGVTRGLSVDLILVDRKPNSIVAKALASAAYFEGVPSLGR